MCGTPTKHITCTHYLHTSYTHHPNIMKSAYLPTYSDLGLKFCQLFLIHDLTYKQRNMSKMLADGLSN